MPCVASADEAYHLVLAVLMRLLRVDMQESDPQLRYVQGIVHCAVRLTIQILPQEMGSVVMITGRPISDRLAPGHHYMEIDQLVQALMQQPACRQEGV